MTQKKYIGGNTIVTSAEMRPRAAFDYYRTDPAAIEAYFRKHPLRGRRAVLDPCAGDGVWGRELRALYPDLLYLYGNEIQPHFAANIDAIQTYDGWRTGDFLTWRPQVHHPLLGDVVFDAVVANPPFSHAEPFFHHSRNAIHAEGTIVFLLRLGFLASERRYFSMFSEEAGFLPTRITVLSTRPSFTGDGNTYPGDFCILRWDFENGRCLTSGILDHIIYERRRVLPQ